jgi:hypothetical protein
VLRVEYRAPILPQNGVFRVVDLRTLAILLLDLPSWALSDVLQDKRRADALPLLAAEPAPAPLLLLGSHLDMLEQLPDEILCAC